MISIYAQRAGQLSAIDLPDGALPEEALEALQRDDLIWIDLLNPTQEEEGAVESHLGVEIPTRQEMAEIEESARIYQTKGALVLTAVVVDGVTRGRPSRAQVTFVLTARHLVSVRYADPQPFRMFYSKIQRSGAQFNTPGSVFVALLSSIIERAADILEVTAAELNTVSNRLFIDNENRRKPSRDEDEMQILLKRLGRKNMTLAFLRESLMSVNRIIPYARQDLAGVAGDDVTAKLKQLERDIRSLTIYGTELSTELHYLHDATLGFISLAQNRIIKVFSIAAVLFLPPTVVGTVYGMNFKHMPELDWVYGYPLAVLLMFTAAIVPVLWLRRKGWL